MNMPSSFGGGNTFLPVTYIIKFPSRNITSIHPACCLDNLNQSHQTTPLYPSPTMEDSKASLAMQDSNASLTVQDSALVDWLISTQEKMVHILKSKGYSSGRYAKVTLAQSLISNGAHRILLANWKARLAFMVGNLSSLWSL